MSEYGEIRAGRVVGAMCLFAAVGIGEAHGDRVATVDTVGAHAYIIAGRDECMVVDTGIAKDPGRILRALSSLGFEAGDVRLIVVTHAHHDHYGAAELERFHAASTRKEQ